MMVVVGENTQKRSSIIVSFHCWKHSMFNGISSMHCNITPIPTIKATGISRNIRFVDFFLKFQAKICFTVCLILPWVSRSSAVLFTQFKKPADTSTQFCFTNRSTTSTQDTFRVQKKACFAWQLRFQIQQQFLSMLQIPQNTKDSVFSST